MPRYRQYDAQVRFVLTSKLKRRLEREGRRGGGCRRLISCGFSSRRGSRGVL
jgi:hypothetical protein